jgi:hypothetical protein
MSTYVKKQSNGLALMLAGILFGVFMFFHPPNNPTGALNPIWAPIHLMWFISYLLILFGLIDIYPILVSLSVRMGRLAWSLSFLGTALSLPVAAWDAFIVPYLAVHAPEMITQVEETSMELPILTFRLIVYLTIIIFSFGFVLMGISIIRSRVMPRIAGLMVLIGAPLFWLGAIIFSQGSTGNIVTIIGAVLFGFGIAWFGYAQRTV